MTLKPYLLATALVATLTPAFADPMRAVPVASHPSHGDVVPVDDAISRLVDVDAGVFVNLDTENLNPGHANTLWFVAIANSSACSATPSTGADVLTKSDEFQAGVGYAGGVIANTEGRAKFSHFQPYGALTNTWFDRGFETVDGAEIHPVIKDHGPIIDDQVAEMLTTFRDACTHASIPAVFPEAATSDGASGPNTWAMVQFSAFLSDVPAS